MGRHGENIRKRADGRWEGRYPVYSEEKKRVVYRSVYGKTYETVKQKLIALKNAPVKQAGKTGQKPLEKHCLQPSKLMFQDAAEEWLKKVKDTKKPSTYVKYTLIYRKYLEKTLKNVKLLEITDCLIQQSILDALSDSSLKSIYCVLNQILNYASRKYSIIVPHMKKPACSVSGKQPQVLTRKEQGCLFHVLYQNTDRYKMAILLCLHTGMRLGEVCALKWEDLDMANQMLAINRTVQRLYAEGVPKKTILLETEPKSLHSKRVIPIPSHLLKLLCRLPQKEEYIFGGNKPVEPRTMQNHFQRILKEAGIAHKNFHILRHTFATNCIEGDSDVKSLSELLGHSNVQITLNRYVHPSIDTKRRYLDALSLFYGNMARNTQPSNPTFYHPHKE